MLKTFQFPTPAIGATILNELKENGAGSSPRDQRLVGTDNGDNETHSSRSRPRTLPDSASELSKAARGLLNRLLDPDPKVRLKNLRQLQQTAFYMGFNFEHVKAKKVAVKTIFERHFPNDQTSAQNASRPEFASFDQSVLQL